MLSLKKLKDLIWEYEYCSSGLSGLSGTDVEVLNLSVNRKENEASADIVFHINEGDSKRTERYDGCIYPIPKLLEAVGQ